MKTETNTPKAAYTAPRLTVHGNVESMTQTWWRCIPHRRYNCSRCKCPSS